MAYSIPEEKIDEVLRKTDIVSVVGEYVSLRPQGSEFSGLCPFHNEKTPSFSVSREKGFYYCHGCKEGGSVFNFLMKIDGLSFVEAVRHLADKAGVNIPEEGGSSADSSQREKSLKEKSALYELHKRLADSFHHLLLHTEAGSEALSYLRSRKINDRMIEQFGLGFALADKDWLYGFLRKKEYSEDFLAKSGFFSKKYPKYPLFVNRLMFPIYDEKDRVVAFSGRAMEENSKAKYINSPGTDIFKKGALLFGISKALKTIREKKEFLLCEGNLDVVSLHQAGVTNAVAPLGTSYSEEQAAFLKRYCTNGVICFDGDAAGKKATERAGLISMRAGITVKVVQMPDGADPADILVKQGEVFLKKIAENTVNFTDFLLNYKFEGKDLNSVEDRETVLSELMDYIRTVESQLRLDEIKEKVASGFNVDKHIISMEIDRLLSQGGPSYGSSQRTLPMQGVRKAESAGETQPRRTPPVKKPGLELMLMLNVAVNRQFFPMVKKELDLSFFSDNDARLIYEALESLPEDKDGDFQVLLEHLRNLSGDDYPGTLLIEKHSSGEFAVNSEEYVVEAIKTVRKDELKRKRISIDLQLKENEQKGLSGELLDELLLEKVRINNELRLLEEAR